MNSILFFFDFPKHIINNYLRRKPHLLSVFNNGMLW
nr:MAG TPA: hypothetical protein [Caudoviricetes sp.]